MSGIHALMDSGRQALFASQTAIQVSGNNIANVNTPGYRRQEVRLEESMSINTPHGQVGTGVEVQEILRHFDEFVENQYNDKASEREMWQTMHENLSSVEALFNESREGALNEALSEFWKDWQELANRPEDHNVRTSLLGKSNNLAQTLNTLSQDLEKQQRQVDDYIQQDVDRVNELTQDIAEINRMINAREVPGERNMNELRNERDSLVRELSEKVDTNYIDRGKGDVTILTKAGQTLVDGSESYEIRFESDKTFSELESDFEGEIKFDGTSGHELTVEIVEDEGEEKFRVSIDGGESWVQDENGNEKFELPGEGYQNRVRVPVDDMEIWFEGDEVENLEEGDEFRIVPKKGLYWYENTSSAMNITPQVMQDGTMNERRLTGGTLAGNFNFRDHYAGKYSEKLDAMAESLAWEVNREHSQGAGLEHLSEVQGTYQVTNQEEPLGSRASGLHFGDKLQQGNFTIHVYDEHGEHESVPVFDDNFDPDEDSLEDVKTAIDGLENLNAEIVNNQLLISADENHKFSFGNDTTGLLAALGINTFFQGKDAQSLSLDELPGNNLEHINAAQVNGAGEVNPGDNSTAKNIAQLQHKEVPIHTSFEGKTEQTLQDYYNSLASNVGADTSMAKYNADYNQALADDLNSRQEEKSGVNLDEEMSNLIKHQHAYQAAARMISTGDEMFQTLLGIKM